MDSLFIVVEGLIAVNSGKLEGRQARQKHNHQFELWRARQAKQP